MELIERSSFLSIINSECKRVAEGEGSCLLLTGEAGIGKTSLIKAFIKEKRRMCRIYQGTCDALFTPRPLGPLYDILWQMKEGDRSANLQIERSELFVKFLHVLEQQETTTIIIFEDIHWADEATLDFIKFFARRIAHFHCLFILTYRDNEIHSMHPLRNVLGQLSPDSFTRLQLTPLSRKAVENLSVEKGYNGEDVYSISNGNPFYVNEILASYSPGVPDNIKDSILSVYNRLDDETKHVLQVLSVLPTGFEIKYLGTMEPLYANAIQNCLDFGILVPKGGLIFFKHELYRRTIETSLSPLVRLALNKKILDLFLEKFQKNGEIERILHHAKNANESEIVVSYANLAAQRASNLGAHTEASKLYFTAIEYYQGNDWETTIQFYESYAYECYLTNHVKNAIIYQERALRIWKEKNNIEKTGNSMRFLSRLWWCDGQLKKAEDFAEEAIKLFDQAPASKAKALALSNMSHLALLSEQYDECILWSEKAIAMSKELDDEEIFCIANANIGTMQMRIHASEEKGARLLLQSLEIALKNNYEEHTSRIYANIVGNAVRIKNYAMAKEKLEEGIQYCEKRDIDLQLPFLMAFKARLLLETGNWNEALQIANSLIAIEDQLPIARLVALSTVARVKIRKGDGNILSSLLAIKAIVFESKEPQRIIPLMSILLEYEWINNASVIETWELDYAISIIGNKGNSFEESEFAFWLLKARKQAIELDDFFEAYQLKNKALALDAADLWKQMGCPYEQALALFEGSDANKRTGLEIIHNLGADAVYEKMKFEMRASGIKNIPRGSRQSTLSNPAKLTIRELDILQLLKEGLQNKEIGAKLFISPKTVNHHISSIFFKLDVNSRTKAVQEAIHKNIIK